MISAQSEQNVWFRPSQLFKNSVFLSGIFQHIFLLSLYDFRYIALILTILIYGAAGTPTPDSFGFVEFAIALLLFIAVGWDGINFIVQPLKRKEFLWLSSARLLFWFGITISIINAVLNGESLILILRDIAAFLFLLLPFFLWPLVSTFDLQKKLFLGLSLIITGLLLAIRDISGLMNISFPFIISGEKLSYLSNSPLVLLASITLAGASIYQIYNNNSLYGWGKSLLLLICMLSPLIAMSIALQRASLGCFTFAFIVFFLVALLAKPYRFLPFLLVISVLIIVISPLLSTFANLFFSKSYEVGLNMRPEEIKAVWKHIVYNNETYRINIFTLLLGTGWGGQFQSPAVGMMEVNFTHGLIGSALLKTGLLGAILHFMLLFYLGSAFVKGAYFKFINEYNQGFLFFIMFFSLMCPYMIDIFLYAAFKSLDFGLILLLMSVFVIREHEDVSLGLVKTAKLP